MSPTYNKIDFVPTNTRAAFFDFAQRHILHSSPDGLRDDHRKMLLVPFEDTDKHSIISVEFLRPEDQARCGLTIRSGFEFTKGDTNVVEDPDGTIWMRLDILAETNWSAEAGATPKILKNRLRLYGEVVALAANLEAVASSTPIFQRFCTKEERVEQDRANNIHKIGAKIHTLSKGLRVNGRAIALSDDPDYEWLNDVPAGRYDNLQVKKHTFSATVTSVGSFNHIEVVRTA